RHAHEARGAISLALFTCRFILRRVPGIGDLFPRRIERNRLVVALGWSELPVAPILSNQRNPITRNVDTRRGSRRRRRSQRSTSALGVSARDGDQHHKYSC